MSIVSYLPEPSVAYFHAFIDTRSMTPAKSFSSPIGSWMGTTFLPNFFCSASSVRENEARSRSILLMTMSRGSSNSSANFQTLLGRHFDAGDAADDDRRGVGDAQRRARFHDEDAEAGRVDED